MGKGRAPCCDKSQVKRGPWSPAEDLRLMSFIQKYGHENWRSLPKQAGLLRCGKSCRLRWINYLRPDVKRGNFTPEEEDTIIRLHQEFGNKWSKIASRLPGRTDNEIKNVWNTHLKKRLSAKMDELADQLSPTPSSSSSSHSSTTTTSSTGKRSQSATDDLQRKKQRTLPNGYGEEEEEDEVVDGDDEDGMLTNNEFKLPDVQPNEISTCSVFPIVTNACPIDNDIPIAASKAEEEGVEDQLDSLFELGESFGNVCDFQISSKPDEDVEFWSLLDGLIGEPAQPSSNVENVTIQLSTDDQLGPTYQSCLVDSGADRFFDDGENENQKWLRYLETELGLEEITNGSENQDCNMREEGN